MNGSKAEAPTRPPVVSVVISTFNRAGSLAATLKSLAEMEVPAALTWELLVVDNNSTDGTRGTISAFAATSKLTLRYLFEAQQGKSFALNAGIQAARGAILAFTDDDVIVDRGWLVGISRAFEKGDGIGIGGRIVPVWNSPKPKWLEEEGPYRLMTAIVKYDFGENPRVLETPPFGANMAFKKAVFEKYGLFRVDLGPGSRAPAPGSQTGLRLGGGGEDTEICWRMMSAGEKLIYTPDVIVFHPVEPHRTRRRYYLEWYVNYGRAEIRSGGWTPETRCYFGVPRYLFRALAGNLLRWGVSVDGKRRFYFKLQAHMSYGSISEARGLARPKKRGSVESERG